MLMTVPYRWDIFPRAPKAHFEQFPDIPPLVVQILYNRGTFEPQDVYSFLSGSYAINDPFLLPDMDIAVTEILAAVNAQTPIAVYGDYDADGVTSTALLMQGLQSLGATVMAYIPNRFTEGYGLNKKAIAKLAEAGTRMIITVDCGIRSMAEVAFGNQLGLKFIITDHHLLGTDSAGNDAMPPAIAVINPKRRDSRYPYRDFAGVGVAFKLVQALYRRMPHNGHAPLNETALLDLVALGTVADMVPLTRENRTLVQRGLQQLQASERAGVRALIKLAAAGKNSITAETIGFVLGPRGSADCWHGDATRQRYNCRRGISAGWRRLAISRPRRRRIWQRQREFQYTAGYYCAIGGRPSAGSSRHRQFWRGGHHPCPDDRLRASVAATVQYLSAAGGNPIKK